MDFVDDVNLVLALRGRVFQISPEIPNFVDTAVGGAVDFKNVEAAASGDFGATGTFVARGRGWAFLAIDRFCKDSCGGGFAHTSRPAK